MCMRQSFVPSRAPLEDNAFVLMNFENGAVGNLWASCVNAGATHDQKIVGEAEIIYTLEDGELAGDRGKHHV